MNLQNAPWFLSENSFWKLKWAYEMFESSSSPYLCQLAIWNSKHDEVYY
jgi:hypothetical protein